MIPDENANIPEPPPPDMPGYSSGEFFEGRHPMPVTLGSESERLMSGCLWLVGKRFLKPVKAVTKGVGWLADRVERWAGLDE
jgi:hypothetical protein